MAEAQSDYRSLQTDKERLKIQEKAKPEITKLYGEKNYDDPEFKNALPQTRFHLADKWIKRAFDAKGDNKEYPKKRENIYKALGIDADPDKIPDGDKEGVIQRIRDFQAANGLKPDGIIGPRTLEKLDKVSDGFQKSVEIKDSAQNIYEPYSVPPETPAVAPASAKETDKAAPSETKKEKTEAEKKNEELNNVEDKKGKIKGELKIAQEENPKKHTDFNKKYDEQREAYKKKETSETSVKETEGKLASNKTKIGDAEKNILITDAKQKVLAEAKVKADLALQQDNDNFNGDTPANDVLVQDAETAQAAFDTAFNEHQKAKSDLATLNLETTKLEQDFAKQKEASDKDKTAYDTATKNRTESQTAMDTSDKKVRELRREIEKIDKEIVRLSGESREAEKAPIPTTPAPAPAETPTEGTVPAPTNEATPPVVPAAPSEAPKTPE